jgi:ferrous iron transport protein B
MRLSELQTGEYGIITKIMGIGAFRKRIMEMGFIKGKKVLVIKNAPLNDPIEYNILGYEVTLRRSEASLIEVITEDEAKNYTHHYNNQNYNGVFTEERLRRTAIERGQVIEVAMVGNPNCGKTSLFNYASNSREHVGNYAGVTVDSKTAEFTHKGYTIRITDLPGTYSLTAYSPEEIYVRKFIGENHPDVIINVVDASNIERNLYLTTQLIDMDIKVVMALNMFDELQKSGHHFNYKSLGEMIGIPVIPTIGAKGTGIPELLDKVISMFNDKEKIRRHIHINYGEEVEKAILKLRSLIKTQINQDITLNFSSRFLAVKLLENDKEAHKILSVCPNYEEIKRVAASERKILETEFKDDSEGIITDAKYGFIAGALKETYKGSLKSEKLKSIIIDSVITNKFWGFPIFLLILWIMFEATFTLGSYPMNWIDSGVSLLGNYLSNILTAGPLKDLIIDGILGGVGGVLIFLPNILLLFLFISIMEDTGYMARAAFIMDKIMHKVGLHGKSFIPLIMGFGCNVPAIMATRTIESRNSRIVTMLINPFFSCSARLPVYVLIISAFAPKYPGLILFLIYILGILVAGIIAILFRKFLFRKQDIPFVMELPPYRVPNPRSTLRHVWSKGQHYLRKMGGIILIASVIVWALGYFPRNINFSKDYNAEKIKVEKGFDEKINSTTLLTQKVTLQKEREVSLNELHLEKESERQQKSYAGQIGKFVEPVMSPLGFDWRMSVSLISGVAAKEIIISTMGILYHVDLNSEGNNKLVERLQQSEYQSGPKVGKRIFSPPVSLAFLIFILIYFPCIAAVTAIAKESGSWKFAAFTVSYTTILAWILAFITYHTALIIF